MNLRLNGSTDLLERARALLGVDEKIYPNRDGPRHGRLYVTIDDHDFEALLGRVEEGRAVLDGLDAWSGKRRDG